VVRHELSLTSFQFHDAKDFGLAAKTSRAQLIEHASANPSLDSEVFRNLLSSESTKVLDVNLSSSPVAAVMGFLLLECKLSPREMSSNDGMKKTVASVSVRKSFWVACSIFFYACSHLIPDLRPSFSAYIFIYWVLTSHP
jgi:hypothetical protein